MRLNYSSRRNLILYYVNLATLIISFHTRWYVHGVELKSLILAFPIYFVSSLTRTKTWSVNTFTLSSLRYYKSERHRSIDKLKCKEMNNLSVRSKCQCNILKHQNRWRFLQDQSCNACMYTSQLRAHVYTCPVSGKERKKGKLALQKTEPAPADRAWYVGIQVAKPA